MTTREGDTMTTTTRAPAAVRFTNSQRAALIVCAPVRLTPQMLAHRPSHNVIGSDAEGNPTHSGRPLLTTDRRWVTTPACQPEPDPAGPHAGRGWCEITAGWADHLGALACPTCFPSGSDTAGPADTVEG